MYFRIKEKYKNQAGIYIIRNTIDNRFYVGSSVHLYKRYKQHLDSLEKGKHHSAHLQNFVDKHGIQTLNFRLMEVCKKEETFKREQVYLDRLQPFGKRGFNTLRVAGTAASDKKKSSFSLFNGVKKFFQHVLRILLLTIAIFSLLKYHKEIFDFLTLILSKLVTLLSKL